MLTVAAVDVRTVHYHRTRSRTIGRTATTYTTVDHAHRHGPVRHRVLVHHRVLVRHRDLVRRYGFVCRHRDGLGHRRGPVRRCGCACRRGNRVYDWTTRRPAGQTGRTPENRSSDRPCTAPAEVRHLVPSPCTRPLPSNRHGSLSDHGCHRCSGYPRRMRKNNSV